MVSLFRYQSRVPPGSFFDVFPTSAPPLRTTLPVQLRARQFASPPIGGVPSRSSMLV